MCTAILMPHKCNPSVLTNLRNNTIKVYVAAVVCASQLFIIESFIWDVIERTVFAFKPNYRMQMLLLFTTVPPTSLGRAGEPWLRRLLLLVRKVDSSEPRLSIIMPESRQESHKGSQQCCLHLLIGVYSFLTKSCPNFILTMHHQMQADGFEVTTAASVSIDFSMSHSKYP